MKYILSNPLAFYVVLCASISLARGQCSPQTFQLAQQQLNKTLGYVDTTHFPEATILNKTGTYSAWSSNPATIWGSGFFPGWIWYTYEQTLDASLLARAQQQTASLSSELTDASGHDIGFRIMNSYGLGYSVTRDPSYMSAIQTAAQTMSKLYVSFPDGSGTFNSWPYYSSIYTTTIIDNMMTIELMFYAAKNGGNATWYNMAYNHALKTMSNQVRADGSTYQGIEYNSDGSVHNYFTADGYSTNSTWSRGQAWGIYGFTMAYRYTRNLQFLDTAQKLANYFIANLPVDYVPYWDFSQNNRKDSSAAAIAAAGFLELSTYSTGAAQSTYYTTAMNIQRSLSTTYYQANPLNTDGILLHGAYNVPYNLEVDTSLIWGDYYFVQGCSRGMALPSQVAGLTSGTLSYNQIPLSWQAQTGAIRYNVKRSTVSGGPYSYITPPPVLTSPSYTDSTVAPNTSYYYVVSASNAAGEGPDSKEILVSTLPFGGSGGGATGTVQFIKSDASTQGNWQSAYGAEGFNVINDTSKYPAYAGVTPSGNSNWTWATTTFDIRGLQKFSNPSARIAATWYSGATFSIDVNLTDGTAHQIALYFVDWDNQNRSERIDILDAQSGSIFDTRTISSFSSAPQYLIWNLKGHVIFKFTALSGPNAVLSGVFFGGSGSATTNTGQFVKSDAMTQGNWQGAYGADGLNIIGDTVKYPSYATVTTAGNSSWIWTATTSDGRALQKYANPNDRIAATWYSATNFTADVNLTDGNFHQLALYFVDWDYQGRGEQIDVIDAQSGNILDTRTLSSFSSTPQYLVWNVKGHVIFKVTSTTGPNAVLSGLFFGAGGTNGTAGSAQFVKTDTTTKGNWQGVYGSDGFNIINDTIKYPSYATIATSGNSNWTWAATTADIRGLQKFSNPNDHIAATWYSGTNFTVDVNLTDGTAHQLAFYCVDWDNQGRNERIDVLDAQTGNLLDTRTISTFSSTPQYLVWNIQGHVIVKFTSLAGPNAVLSGLFFQ